jgi:glycogen debranching enzyme
VAVHGRRSAILGYAQNGLEIWAWPFQVLRGYRIEIRPQDATAAINGERLLRRIEYRPDSVVRIYAGSDFIVRETLFVPLDQPGAIITYKVEGRGHVDISLHFIPVLDLMWPASTGGQSTAWNEAVSGYVMSDVADGFTAPISSAKAVTHDSTENSAIRYHDGLAFTVRPDASAQVFVALTRDPSPGALIRQLAAEKPALEQKAVAHYASLVHDSLQIETPDEEASRPVESD